MLGKTQDDLLWNLKNLVVSQDTAKRPTRLVDFFVASITLCTSQFATAIKADKIPYNS